MPSAEVTSVGFGPDGKPGPNTHHLVTYQTIQVSVDNNGMIHLGLHRPQDVDDLIEALRKARDVGLDQQRTNQEAQAKADAAVEAQKQRQAAAAQRLRDAANAPRAAKRVKSERVDQPATSRPVRKAPAKKQAAKAAPRKAVAKRTAKR